MTGIRETINKRPGIAAGAGAAVLALALVIIFWSNQSPHRRVSQAYYTADDGKTWFADDIDQVYPFDHNGKPAYRAYVYQCADSEPFVSYIARYPDAAKVKLTELEGDPDAAGEIAQLRGSAIEVRKPGDVEWVPLFSSRGEQIARHPTCPDGRVAMNLYP